MGERKGCRDVEYDEACLTLHVVHRLCQMRTPVAEGLKRTSLNVGNGSCGKE